MTIWLVFVRNSEGEHVDRIFSSEALAEEYVNRRNSKLYFIEQWQVLE